MQRRNVGIESVLSTASLCACVRAHLRVGAHVRLANARQCARAAPCGAHVHLGVRMHAYMCACTSVYMHAHAMHAHNGAWHKS